MTAGEVARRAMARLDRLDRRRWARPGADPLTEPGLLAASWATARVLSVSIGSPLVGPAVARRAMVNTALMHRRAVQYPDVISEMCRGASASFVGTDRPLEVGAASAGGRWFVSSDLHRCVAGSGDWPGRQNTKDLYAAVLDRYAADAWGLIENGDVEDFWMCGGSAYGVGYDALRLAAHAMRGARGADARARLARHHLRRIVANNQAIYRRIQEMFHDEGRYRRLVGNHDDVFLDRRVGNALREVHPGLEIYDAVVMRAVGVPGRDHDTAIGVVTHGHHTDAWCSPERAGLGKLGTWLGSALADVPRFANPSIPAPDTTDALFGGASPNALVAVHPRFGADRTFSSLDEVDLFASCRRAWGTNAADLEGGPWIVLGHTHVPLARPHDSESGGVWERYVNSGAGILRDCITGVEWDGSRDDAHPDVRVVGWRMESGELTRYVFERDEGDGSLIATRIPTRVGA